MGAAIAAVTCPAAGENRCHCCNQEVQQALWRLVAVLVPGTPMRCEMPDADVSSMTSPMEAAAILAGLAAAQQSLAVAPLQCFG